MGGNSHPEDEGDVAVASPAPCAGPEGTSAQHRTTDEGAAWVKDADTIRRAVIAHLKASFGRSLAEADYQDLAQEAFTEMLRREAQGTEIREP